MKAFDLQGLRVLNTRPTGEQHRAFEKALQAFNGQSIALPAMVIEATPNTWVQTLPPLHTLDYAVFISANAVHYFFLNLHAKALAWPSTITTIAIGEATAKALEHHGIDHPIKPVEPDSEHVLDLPELCDLKQKTVLLVKGQGGRDTLALGIDAGGGHRITVDVYARKRPDIEPRVIEGIWRNDAVDIILYTSQQSIETVFELFGAAAKHWLQNKPCLVISQRLAKTAQALGIQTIHVASPFHLIEALQQLKLGKRL